MANPTYPKGFPAHLATNFRWMVSNGRSAAQVCEILTMVLRHREIKTVPPLPDGWRLLPVGGELKLEAADGTIYDAREMTLRQMVQDILDKTALGTLKLTVCAEHAGGLVVHSDHSFIRASNRNRVRSVDVTACRVGIKWPVIVRPDSSITGVGSG
jgi:hypothetical protein